MTAREQPATPLAGNIPARLTWCTLCLVLFAVIALTAIASPGHAAQVASAEDTRAAIEKSLRGAERLPLPVERVRNILTIHYLEQNGALFWVGTPRLQQLIDRLANAKADGLKPKDYPADYLVKLHDAANLSLPDHAAFTELMFTSFFLVYAADIKVGRFVPAKIDPELYLDRRTVNGPETLAKLAQFGDLTGFFADWEPQRAEYRALKVMLAQYRALEHAGGWPRIDPSDALKPGMDDLRVAQVRARLQASGDYTAGGTETSVYDDTLVAAVRRFQKRHGLDADGVIGKQSLLALNIKVQDRILQIIANMERWRWMPEQLGDDYIMVNIAGFELTRVQRKKIVRRMKVVVGKTYHRTPVFSGKIRYLEFNPTWTVPMSIATKEMLPQLQKDPDRYASKGFDLLQGGTPVSWYGVDWSQYSRSRFPYVFRQQPGDNNALGRVKFIFPNKHNVYLHDTPSRGGFARSNRALSHGCVRLSEPVKFAEEVLASKPGWSRSKIDALLASRETTRVNLDKPLSVHLVYATAWLEDDGTVHFRPDIYGRDQRLYRALFAKHTP